MGLDMYLRAQLPCPTEVDSVLLDRDLAWTDYGDGDGPQLYIGGWKFGHDTEQALFAGVAQALGCERIIDAGSPSITLYRNTRVATVNVGYWRKANQIHTWFVQHVQGGVDECHVTPCTRAQLETLRDLCRQVMQVIHVEPGIVINGYTLDTKSAVGVEGEHGGRGPAWKPIEEDGLVITSSELVAELLPTRSGFFFGSTDYDEYYLREIEHTLTVLDRVLGHEPELENFTYRSDW